MATNIKSLSLLRNGKVYPTRNLALSGFLSGTDDGVAKLCRYRATDGNIKTIIGFYANADQMEDAAGGNSFYTIIDLEALSKTHDDLQREIDEINEIIGDGIPGTTLTDAINDINDRIGSGFTSAHTIADALEELREELTLYAGNGISIENNIVSAVAAAESADGVTNPITVDGDGIKFSTKLDCGYFDD